MSETNWNTLSSGLDAATVARGVSAGFTEPNGGGDYIFGFNSLDDSVGAVGLYCNESGGFNPMVSGCSVRGAIKRATSAGPLDYSCFLFGAIQGTTVNDSCYMLGLSNADPYKITLVKGVLANGIPAASTADTVLAFSTESFNPDTWHHLRLDIISNPNGDVILKCFESDLDTYGVDEDAGWTAITGMSDFTDDALGANSYDAGNSDTPYVGGRAGFGFTTSALQRRAFFDHIRISRQT